MKNITLDDLKNGESAPSEDGMMYKVIIDKYRVYTSMFPPDEEYPEGYYIVSIAGNNTKDISEINTTDGTLEEILAFVNNPDNWPLKS